MIIAYTNRRLKQPRWWRFIRANVRLAWHHFICFIYPLNTTWDSRAWRRARGIAGR